MSEIQTNNQTSVCGIYYVSAFTIPNIMIGTELMFLLLSHMSENNFLPTDKLQFKKFDISVSIFLTNIINMSSANIQLQIKTRDVFVKHGCPQRQQSPKYGKNLPSPTILTPPNPQGHGMSVKCEEPIDELTV